MKRPLFSLLILLTLLTPLAPLTLLTPHPQAEARRIGYKLKPEKARRVDSNATISPDSIPEQMAPGSFMVASQCESCNNGYRLDQVVFTGFDKKRSSAKESFFIINNTDRELSGATLYIDYRTPDGRQLTRRFIRLSCSIPPGETRKVDIDTWDTQRSFQYYKSDSGKKPGNPFTVIFDPIAYWLRFDP